MIKKERDSKLKVLAYGTEEALNNSTCSCYLSPPLEAQRWDGTCITEGTIHGDLQLKPVGV